ncbi:MAG: Cof-type HAD-IIB family hydrolase [Neisseriaceae bacterium]|nr:Cof-type HAD-IIB family hydrolase [Neisseriaceae bacterium]
MDIDMGMMNPPKIIFFDIDNTLYITKENRIPESTLYALDALRKQGIITAIATGRTLSVLPEQIRQLIAKQGIDMVAIINGQYVQYQGKELVSFALDADTVENVANYFRTNNIAHGFVDEQGISVALMNDFVHQSCQETRVAYQYNPAHQYERPIYQILGFYPEEYDAHVASMLPEHLKLVRWHRLGVDILPREGSKARGIAASLQQLDLTLHDAWAFGDGHNDLEMIQEVAFGVVMADGEEVLKTYANYICPSAKEDGIYHCLVQLGIIQAR